MANLTKFSFTKGMTIINSILTTDAQILGSVTFDTYYALLKDIDEDVFEKAMIKLCKEWEFANIPPTPGNIRKFCEESSSKIVTYEEKALLKRINAIQYGEKDEK